MFKKLKCKYFFFSLGTSVNEHHQFLPKEFDIINIFIATFAFKTLHLQTNVICKKMS